MLMNLLRALLKPRAEVSVEQGDGKLTSSHLGQSFLKQGYEPVRKCMAGRTW